MVQRGEQLRLAREARQPLGIVGERGGQDLDGDVAIESRVAGAIDLAHAARPEGAGDFIRTDAASRAEGHGDAL